MKRQLVSFALSLALCACAEAVEEPTLSAEPSTEQTPDAWVSADEPDAAAPLTLEVSNVGEPCSPLTGCHGATAKCMLRSSTVTPYPGGYCTSECTSDAQCGPGGICPVGEAERVSPDYDFVSAWPRRCFRSCTPGPESGCRADYRCESLAAAYRHADAPASMHRTICIPRGANTDAGAAAAEASQ